MSGKRIIGGIAASPDRNQLDVQGPVKGVLLARWRLGHLLEVAGGDKLLPVVRCTLLVPVEREQGSRECTKILGWNTHSRSGRSR